MLYLCDTCGLLCDDLVQEYFESLGLEGNSREFARELFVGAQGKRQVLDKLIGAYTQNWELDRMAAVDRNILRLATFEILNMTETPINVIIDEAVEIAKRYSTIDSGKFVNGILDKLKQERKTQKTGTV
ncbi:MAG: transcription antitermination factor NusB [Endomicrobiales bacterium]|nr:transcription antitermination factor NusB [Endomicrobiales bacterium]